MKKIEVAQTPGDEVPTEVLATSIREIAEGMRKLRAGKLNDRALLVLLKDSTGVPIYMIKRVLDGMESLQKNFLQRKVSDGHIL